MTDRIKVALLAVIAFSILTLSGCGSDSHTDAEMAPASPEAQTAGTPESLDSPALPAISEGRTSAPMLPVYFDFDSSAIREDQVSRIKANADFLKENGDVMVRIEGNCDPRGTNEYNMALGERRALSAKKFLVDLGIDGARISTISFGEERILLHGHDELSWAQNRRDDFVIMQ
ncbi:MAG: OmpA family protein [Desulfopila sp.]|nr:OmpA family protein [Desulfopila sp.]